MPQTFLFRSVSSPLSLCQWLCPGHYWGLEQSQSLFDACNFKTKEDQSTLGNDRIVAVSVAMRPRFCLNCIHTRIRGIWGSISPQKGLDGWVGSCRNASMEAWRGFFLSWLFDSPCVQALVSAFLDVTRGISSWRESIYAMFYCSVRVRLEKKCLLGASPLFAERQ